MENIDQTMEQLFPTELLIDERNFYRMPDLSKRYQFIQGVGQAGEGHGPLTAGWPLESLRPAQGLLDVLEGVLKSIHFFTLQKTDLAFHIAKEELKNVLASDSLCDENLSARHYSESEDTHAG